MKVYEETIKVGEHTLKIKFTRSLHGVKGEYFVGVQRAFKGVFSENTTYYGPINDLNKVAQVREELISWEIRLIKITYAMIHENLQNHYEVPTYPN